MEAAQRRSRRADPARDQANDGFAGTGLLTVGGSSLSVSVLIPAYNAEKLIERAINSVIAQDYPAEEIIVIDDGSTDGTRDRLDTYGDKIRLISQPNMGASRTRNRGILEARSEFVAFLDADDYWMPSKLSEQVELLNRNSSTGFVSCHARIEDNKGEQLGQWEFDEQSLDLLHELFVRHAGIPGSLSAVVAKRSLFAEVGLFDVSLSSQEDIDMWIRLSARTGHACVRNPLTTITRQAGSVSSNYSSMLECARQVMQNNRTLLPPSDRIQFWQAAYSGMLTDYAKWASRDAKPLDAIGLLVEAGWRSRKNWRLIAGLLLAILKRENI